jgi:glycerol-3-phosphate acyltransferase PlsY
MNAGVFPLAAAFVGGYLLGSIPFGLLFTFGSGLGDVRRIGSGNIGATNVLRTGRKDLALATLLLDGGKGAAAVLLAAAWGGQAASLTAGAGAVLGHLFPVWLRFRGGKGVATGLGVLLGAAFWAGLAACAVWLATAKLTRISSAAALAAFAAAPLLVWGMTDGQHAVLALFISVVVYFRHRENIRRLLKGTEPHISARK